MFSPRSSIDYPYFIRKGAYHETQVKVTILDKKLYPELQQQYCADPKSGACPCYHVGDEYIFERTEENDSFWRMGSIPW